MSVPILGWLQGEDFDYGIILIVIAVIIFGVAISYIDIPQSEALTLLIATSPVWLPFFSVLVFFNIWMQYVGRAFVVKNGRATIRIHLPQDVLKSPEAMEYVIGQIWNQASPDNLWETYIDGKRPLNYSFEIVSIGGEVRLYMNLPARRVKDAAETMLYSQYPGIEIETEPVDYAAEVPFDSPDHEVMVFHMGKKKGQEFPIKTYIDYGLDKLPKEEEKLDPMTPMLEFMSRIKSYERMYVQIICLPHRDYSFKNGSPFTKVPKWDGGVKKEIENLMNSRSTAGDFESTPRLTPGERSTIESMERNVEKYAYETAIRWVYITEKGKFNGDYISPMIRTFSQYDMIGRNEIGVRWRTDFNYNWFADPFDTRKRALKIQEMKEYKMRKYYNKAQSDNRKVFTTEELATMFHVPGQVATTPTLGRISSMRSQAPSNLPIGN